LRPEREVRKAGQTRLETVHDVEPAAHERQREARPDSDRNSHPAPTGDRNGRAERDQLGVVKRTEQGASPGGEVSRTVRGRQDRDRVAASSQLTSEAVHVLVHVVRLRPGERRDERDPHGDRV